MLSQDSWVPIGRVPCYSLRFVQSIREEDVHRGNLALWQVSGVVHLPIEELSYQCCPATVASTKELTYLIKGLP
ncbi:hypothetical protein TNCV_3009141 [Trichonephila clavipes]|nr:hypothetical protein TNCV_3009141 [Trichonephila clavipes]